MHEVIGICTVALAVFIVTLDDYSFVLISRPFDAAFNHIERVERPAHVFWPQVPQLAANQVVSGDHCGVRSQIVQPAAPKRCFHSHRNTRPTLLAALATFERAVNEYRQNFRHATPYDLPRRALRQPILEVVRIESLHLVGPRYAYANVVFNHQICKPSAVDQNDSLRCLAFRGQSNSLFSRKEGGLFDGQGQARE
jgi:hypothetical protein